jgi:adenylate kinase
MDHRRGFIFLGPPLCGKGTQGKNLAKKYDYCIVSPGDIFRQEIKNSTELGLKVKNYVNAGKLVPNNIVNDVIKKYLDMPNCKSGFVLDGFPRTMEQLEYLNTMKISSADLSAIILLIDKEESFKRVVKRKQIEKRVDDELSKVLEIRWKEYYEKTVPVIEFYKSRGNAIMIDGIGSIKEIEKRITESLIQKTN